MLRRKKERKKKDNLIVIFNELIVILPSKWFRDNSTKGKIPWKLKARRTKQKKKKKIFFFFFLPFLSSSSTFILFALKGFSEEPSFQISFSLIFVLFFFFCDFLPCPSEISTEIVASRCHTWLVKKAFPFLSFVQLLNFLFLHLFFLFFSSWRNHFVIESWAQWWWGVH